MPFTIATRRGGWARPVCCFFSLPVAAAFLLVRVRVCVHSAICVCSFVSWSPACMTPCLRPYFGCDRRTKLLSLSHLVPVADCAAARNFTCGSQYWWLTARSRRVLGGCYLLWAQAAAITTPADANCVVGCGGNGGAGRGVVTAVRAPVAGGWTSPSQPLSQGPFLDKGHICYPWANATVGAGGRQQRTAVAQLHTGCGNTLGRGCFRHPATARCLCAQCAFANATVLVTDRRNGASTR